MSRIESFNEFIYNKALFTSFPDYEKEYRKKFKKNSKNIKNYYQRYLELSDSDTSSSSDDDDDDMQIVERKTVAPNVNTALSSFMMEFNGIKIRQRPEDGFVNATDMCKVNESKSWARYHRTGDKKEFINKLSSEVQICTSELIISKRGGNSQKQGTWVHPRIAIDLARWISPAFGVKMTEIMQQFIEGDETLIADAVKQREKVKNITSHVSLVDISNELGLSEKEKQEELLQMHQSNINMLEKQLHEKDVVIKQKDDKIDDLKRMIAEMRQESKQALSEIKDIALDQTKIAIKTQKSLTITENKLDTVKTKLDTVETKLVKVETTLDRAVDSVVEKRNTRSDQNYLCVLRLETPKRSYGNELNYYVIRCCGNKQLKRCKQKVDYEEILFTLGPNYAINSWKIIKDKLNNKIKSYGNYFSINISENEMENAFRKVLNMNRNRVKTIS